MEISMDIHIHGKSGGLDLITFIYRAWTETYLLWNGEFIESFIKIELSIGINSTIPFKVKEINGVRIYGDRLYFVGIKGFWLLFHTKSSYTAKFQGCLVFKLREMIKRSIDDRSK